MSLHNSLVVFTSLSSLGEFLIISAIFSSVESCSLTAKWILWDMQCFFLGYVSQPGVHDPPLSEIVYYNRFIG